MFLSKCVFKQMRFSMIWQLRFTPQFLWQLQRFLVQRLRVPSNGATGQHVWSDGLRGCAGCQHPSCSRKLLESHRRCGRGGRSEWEKSIQVLAGETRAAVPGFHFNWIGSEGVRLLPGGNPRTFHDISMFLIGQCSLTRMVLCCAMLWVETFYIL